jgi:YggT family protein
MDLLVQAIAQILDMALTAYMWVVIISAVLSWVNPDPYNPIVRFLRNLTEPVFWKVRKLVPFAVVGGLDLTPVLVIFAIYFVRIFVVGNLFRLALHLA